MDEAQYVLEYAKTGRSKCSAGKLCSEPIEKGQMRLGTIFRSNGMLMKKFRHFECTTRAIFERIGAKSNITILGALKDEDISLVDAAFQAGYVANGKAEKAVAQAQAMDAAKKAQKEAAKDQEKQGGVTEESKVTTETKGSKVIVKDTKVAKATKGSSSPVLAPAANQSASLEKKTTKMQQTGAKKDAVDAKAKKPAHGVATDAVKDTSKPMKLVTGGKAEKTKNDTTNAAKTKKVVKGTEKDKGVINKAAKQTKITKEKTSGEIEGKKYQKDEEKTLKKKIVVAVVEPAKRGRKRKATPEDGRILVESAAKTPPRKMARTRNA